MLRTAICLQKKMWSSTTKELVAICQMTANNDLEKNFEAARGMIERAGNRNCKMVFLPECFDYIGNSKEETIGLAMSSEGDYMNRYRELAKKHKLWLSLGGLHNKKGTEPLPLNTHLIIDDTGATRAEYNKLHLFDLEIPGKVRLMESEFSRRGTEMIPPVDTPIGKIGLGICYDMRFPELALWNRKKGAHIMAYPSAFTLTTGLAHWEALLRARAIETQSYVIASAQTGSSNPKRQSYGHSIVVDPWGAVVAQCSERVDMAFAEVDIGYVEEIRQLQPVMAHRRSDLYSLHVNEKSTDTTDMVFEKYPIAADTIFYRTAHSFAFVNLKPVLDGHVLVSPCRIVKRLTDLTDEETADLFIVAKKVQKMLESFYNVTSSTVCVQDGKDAGQTVSHVHVHILPRKPTDFGGDTDALYKHLAENDKKEKKERTHEEMKEEAEKYKNAM